MSFRRNNKTQLSLIDNLEHLTEREKKALRRSWAATFAEDIFPYIDEEQFRCLYSDTASRPNTPVNVIVGAMILKETFQISDDEVIDSLMLDARWQLALHTQYMKEQPLSDKSLTRFRNRCLELEDATGENPFKACILGLAEQIKRLMKISGRVQRMDSLMIAANIEKLTRAQLLYTCVANMVKSDSDSGYPVKPEHEHYIEKSDFNAKFYHANDDERANELITIICDAEDLLELKDGIRDNGGAYRNLERALREQTTPDESGVGRRLRKSEDGGMTSSMLQNPSDPDATFRTKAGKEHRGYTGNVVESVGENGSVITGYDLQPNNYSDSQFLKDHLNGLEDDGEETTIVLDGAYGGQENEALAAGKNVTLVPTGLSGQAVDPVFGDFEFDENNVPCTCPAGFSPRKVGNVSKNGSMTLTFDREQCANCPHRDQCGAKIRKKCATVSISRAKHDRARYAQFMGTDEFLEWSHLRNGVETVPAALRKKLKVDRMPVSGVKRNRLWFGAKIGAFNFRKLLGYRNHTSRYAVNEILVGM